MTTGAPRRVDVVMGTRPEVIKLAPVVIALRRRPEVSVRVVFTGQHADIGTQALYDFGLSPDLALASMDPGQSLSSLLARLVAALGPATARGGPDVVIGQGDSSSAFAAAIAAHHARVPFAHVEAGLRTPTLHLPFPEEGYRRAISALSTVHFAPTPASAQRLVAEGHDPAQVHHVGNTVVDAQRLVLSGMTIPRPPSSTGRVLVTLHRRELIADGLTALLSVVVDAARERPHLHFCLLRHPNPAVARAIDALASLPSNITVLDPQPHGALTRLLAETLLLVTDSGGLQEEAACLGIPTVVAREVTDRPEPVAEGLAVLAGTRPKRFADTLRDWLDVPPMRRPIAAFGDGHAADRIAELLFRSA
ncbi:MAG: UDP-N-acetylglucosamine 2-epimerase (non-hydrolyzing) [Myxococcales bacterium]|nr:UDP-N-acetylglucosamine 2-epimerase (non-hydrolyzing) [Myxococcales bacterium]